MNIINYCVVAVISILFLIGCLAHLSENDIFSRKRIGKFYKLIFTLMFETIIDCIFEILTVSNTPIGILYVIKGVEMVIMPVLIYLVFDIFYDKRSMRQNKVMQKLGLVILSTIIANAVAIVVLPVFRIDADRVYHRGQFVFIYIVLLAIGLAALIWGMVIFSGKTQSTMKQTMLAFASILITSIVLRAFFPAINYDFLCLSVAVPFLLIYYSHIVLRVDTLTRLLNRQVYSKVVKRINYTTIVIMIDANNFKKINDTHGHECGDRTLKQIGYAIYEAYGKIANCFRIGGDEFCVILKPDVFERIIEKTPYRDVYTLAEQLMDRLDEILSIKAESDDEGLLKYGVAQGYGVYYSQMSSPNIYDIIALADKRMYDNKEKFKKEHPEPQDVKPPKTNRPRVIYEPSTIEIVREMPDKPYIPHNSIIENNDQAGNVQDD